MRLRSAGSLAKDASPFEARVQKSQHIVSIAFSGSKQITGQGQIHHDGKNDKELGTFVNLHIS